MDGGGRKKAIRLLQIIFLTFFIIISLTGLHQNIKFSDVIAKTSNKEDIGESTEAVKIVIANNNHEEPEQEFPKENEYAFTVVTGASENHFCPVKGFIYNLKGTLKGLNARVIIYDLGLTEIQRDELKSLKDNGFFDEIRVFDFTNFPSFWNISEARGEYAWKPAIVAEVSKEFPGIITWLDSGTLPERIFFEELPTLLKTYNGFLSPRSSGFMKNWTHPGVYEYYNDDASKYDNIPNCSGASVAFDTKMTQHIINEWYTCALDKNCIAPVGSNRKNHRQDQAILTYLVAREERYCNIGGKYLWIHAHQDSNCETIIDFYEKLYNIN
ncbi:hypothetical protein RhiirA1_521637 [Rhizophagus irregularis]|uniref:Uncharacterized protein n=3 Tax=Rhizophagus irregularis TaxID=588596 RepID=U9TCZ7_RHIID|nr:hypothetical protein GLOIN_2v1469365 [Rhizophagus irregularis DAOM 181602=DAOM 197198]EXX53008.1 hypothetical protein RirG_248080 [Rhizophagus irregularis DAOM 197198w]PKC62524.1 hypothetical protein RhiirA1_521637 [Rhizophagus irregularis]PKK67936.1 hypothetical protein RhiirC2_557671 [Rhizophagus irregularis]PKY25376.1 hypothetical protein RhiirB3_414048 [Rhizophagus irregularis]POG83226.1 hypothetical protein GLOIN_2v1469365 [Rhizophagus irregularis DAOM 181602=DAOM 197198]|eukprot:XP_025190092.1 hypothetical protein GLOIN_2v1469365 [Rhizophagus irregularis DAOM 181602=DAOM 197198]